MILSGRQIKEVQNDKIIIAPFHEEQVNPNSYNLRLHNQIGVYEDPILDMKRNNALKIFTIPTSGFLLEPHRLYLARTIEYTATDYYVPMLEGRSSLGRLGLNVHVTAGFGDIGFSGYWTLEMHAIAPIWIYPGVDICQIYYHTIEGDYDLYQEKHAGNNGLEASKMYLDFQGGN